MGKLELIIGISSISLASLITLAIFKHKPEELKTPSFKGVIKEVYFVNESSEGSLIVPSGGARYTALVGALENDSSVIVKYLGDNAEEALHKGEIQ